MEVSKVMSNKCSKFNSLGTNPKSTTTFSILFFSYC